MVQDDSHPVANKKGYENGSGYGRQGGRKEAIDTIGSIQPQGYEQHDKPPSTLSQLGSQALSAHTNGYAQEKPSSLMPKPNSTQAQGNIESSTIHNRPSPTQVRENQSHNSSSVSEGRSAYNHVHKRPPSEEARNQPHQPPSGTTKYHVPTLPSHGGNAHHQPTIAPARRTRPQEFEHRNWISGVDREPKSVPSVVHQLDHVNGDEEPNKFETTNEKSSDSPPDKPSIQVNVNVYYDRDGTLRVNSAPRQPTPPRQAPAPVPIPASALVPVPAPAPARQPPARPPPYQAPAPARPARPPSRQAPVPAPPARPPPPKSSSSGCCSIL